MNKQVQIEYYKQMLQIRLFEESIETLFNEGAIFGTTHLCIGQEAVPVGISDLLSPNDLTVSNHRGHGHFLARGVSARALYSELLGRIDGCCKGRGGTQHLCDPKLGHLGSNGITSGMLPIAAGAALSMKYTGSGHIAVAYFGDGTVGEGLWHETMNIASVWKLPILFVCENNLYAMSTPVSVGISGKSIATKAAAYDIPWRVADGNDVNEVHNTAAEMIPSIRDLRGPGFIEFRTYRHKGHSKSDARDYRTRDEEAQWLLNDPIVRQRKVLAEIGLSDLEIIGIETEINRVLSDSLEQAKKSPWPEASSLTKEVYSECK